MATVSSAESNHKVPESAPDISKLGGMTSRTVSVAKVTARTGAEHLILSAWRGVSMEDILALPDQLKLQYGPGTYRIMVQDEGGPEKVTWFFKNGGADVLLQEDLNQMTNGNGSSGRPPFMSVGGGTSGNGVPQTQGGAGFVGIDSNGIRHIGQGYTYDSDLGLLTTPTKQIVSWRQGDPLPGQFGATAAAASLLSSQPSAPVGAPGGGSMMEDPRLRQMEDTIRKMEEQQRDEERKREAREQREALARLVDESNKRFESLVAKLSDKPTGPTPAEVALTAQIQEMRSQVQQQAQQLEARTRDSESAAREDRLRTEIKSTNDRLEMMLREATTNRTDPTLQMLTSVMTASQAAQTETIRAIQSTSGAQASAAERNAQTIAERLGGSIMTPLQIVELMKMSKDTSANSEINKSMVEMFQNLFGMAKGLVREQAEMYSGANGPSWLPMAQQGVEALGRVAQTYAAQKARADAENAHVRQQAAQAPQRRQAQQQQAAAQRPAVPIEVYEEPSPADIRDAAAREIFNESPRAAANMPQVSTPSAAATAQAAQAPRRRRSAAQAPAPQQRQPAQAPVAAQAAMMREASMDEMLAITNTLSDEQFFGELLLPEVDRLRDAVTSGEISDPDQIVAVIAQAHQAVTSFGGKMPPVIELLVTGHFEILIDRLLPETMPDFRAEIVELLHRAQGAAIQEGDAA